MKVKHLQCLLVLLLSCVVFAVTTNAQTFNQTSSDPLDTAQDPLNSKWSQCPNYSYSYVTVALPEAHAYAPSGSADACELWNQPLVNNDEYIQMTVGGIGVNTGTLIFYIRSGEFGNGPGPAYRLSITQTSVNHPRGPVDLVFQVDVLNTSGTSVHTFVTGLKETFTALGPRIAFGLYGQNYEDTTLYLWGNGVLLWSSSVVGAGGSNYVPSGTVGFGENETAADAVNTKGFTAGYITQ